MKSDVYRKVVICSVWMASVWTGLTNPVRAESVRTAADAVTPVSRIAWDMWKERYDEKVAEIRTGRHYDVVFVGDSITHYWERDFKANWEKWMGKYNPLNLGILADETQHVLWRLTEGGQLDGYGPRAFVILIGTNNVGNNPPGAEKPEWVVAGVKKILQAIERKHAGSKVLLMAILPRSRDNDIQCGYPKVNAQINAQLASLAKETYNTYWLDCGSRLLSAREKDGMTYVDTRLMPDSLHPNEAGYDILGEEITRKLDQMLSPEPGTMPLWPEGKMPDAQIAQRMPEMIVTLPEKRTTDAIMIVAPGGSYEKLCTWEDEQAARMFNGRGMATVQLRYRVPRPVNAPKHRAAWQDAQRAVRLVRAHAKAWKVNPEKIGFLGHSAGGHLTVMAAVSSSVPAYAPIDEIDRQPCHVNFAVPCYPAYLVDGKDVLDAAFAFDRMTPPMCFLHGEKDGYVWGSLAAVTQLKKRGKDVEMHLFARRNHADLPFEDCLQLTWAWLEKVGIVAEKP